MAESKVQTVTRFKTTDGMTFESPVDAEKYQHILEFDNWYDGLQEVGKDLSDDDGRIYDSRELLAWLQDNKEVLLKFLS